jgi:CheY-like chemotaxis protein
VIYVLKMFSTQLQGLFKKVEEKEAMNLEEGARLLSQALIGDGTVFIHGLEELKAVELTATIGLEPLEGVLSFFTDGEPADLSALDRVLIITRFSTDPDAIQFVKRLKAQEIPVVAISSIINEGEEELHQLVDVHINSHLTKGLLPDDNGNRFGFPSAMIALYTYYGLMFTIQEIIAEYE